MKTLARLSLIAAAVVSAPSQAGIIDFTNNPSGNSVDWTNAVTAMGGQIDSSINFDTMPTGPLDSNFYTLSHGVTLLPSGDVNTIVFGAGPANGNTATGPHSNGEGLHAPSNYLLDGSSQSQLTINLPQNVVAFGLDIIDYFNPAANGGANLLQLLAYTGANGTGTLLGSVNSVAFNFQNNYTYFMGLISDDSPIGSIVFKDAGLFSDVTGLDNFVFATYQSVPAPAGFGLLISGLWAGFLLKRRS